MDKEKTHGNKLLVRVIGREMRRVVSEIPSITYRWLEGVLGVALPPATELESALQNGVILCRLGVKLLPDDPMWSKVYDLDESKFKVRMEPGQEFRNAKNARNAGGNCGFT